MPSFLAPRLRGDRPNERQKGARFALVAFALINLLNYADRYVPASVKHLLKEDLQLTDTETSLPGMGMLIVYMVLSIFFGWLADKDLIDRRLILAGAIAFWSLATALAGLADGIVTLVLFRSLVGVGEAAYMAIAPVMIADFYPPSERNMAFTVFSLSMPVGSALGFGAGGALGGAFGWRVAFLACGAPGLVVAFLVLLVDDPASGINDAQEEKPKKRDASVLHDYWAIATNVPYALATAGMVANSFCVGALADWYAEFLARRTETSVTSAGLVLGAATAAGGLGGCLLGSEMTQRFEGRLKNAFFLIPGLFMLPAAFLTYMSVNYVEAKRLAYVCIAVGEIFMFTYIPPLSSVSISVIPVELRSRSAGLQIFISHVLGDVISPPIVGHFSDATGSLQTALQVSWIMLLVSAVWWFIGARCVQDLPSFSREDEKASMSMLLCGAQPQSSSRSSKGSGGSGGSGGSESEGFDSTNSGSSSSAEPTSSDEEVSV